MPLSAIAPDQYATLLAAKLRAFKDALAPYDLPEPTVQPSAALHFRLRVEFRIWQRERQIDYAMFDPNDRREPKQPIAIEHFPVASEAICALMPALLASLRASNVLRDQLYQVNFLATLSGEMLVTLIYHRPLTPRWEMAARQLAEKHGILLIGRSRKQKVVLERDWVEEVLVVGERRLHYRQVEGAFSQPNGELNRQMLGWACQQAAGLGGDLLELYCGNGNFTVALAPSFARVLATEVSTASVQAAQHNLAANGIANTQVLRVASEDVSAALAGEPGARRLEDIDLDGYRFSTLFVDPPRSGLDATTLQLASGFEHILYISCNPQTLQENVAALHATHRIAAAAVFDQFPYTHHLESGLLLTRR